MQIDKYISTLVSDQFPQFYQAEGDNFIAFVRAYYEWMEQEGYTTNASKNLLNYHDIDKTIDDFVDSFKGKYLVDFPSITAVDKRFIIKRIKDFYKAKGSEKGIKLLFRLLFDDDIEIYSPGKDILKASDGIWKIPIYIELEHNPRNITFVSKRITGVISGASAFVESVYTKNVNQRQIDIVTLSSIQGNFLYGESVTDDGNLVNAPAITGSLTQINITDGGANNKVGDIFEVNTSTNGKGGKVRVAEITDGTGRVDIKLIDGGSGYTLDPNQVKISNVVFFTSNRSGNYGLLERVFQDLNTLEIITIFPDTTEASSLTNKILKGYDTVTGPLDIEVATGLSLGLDDSNSRTFILNTIDGDFTLADTIKNIGNTVTISAYDIINVTASGTLTGYDITSLGLHDINNTFYANGGVIVSDTGITANVTFIASGSGANFEIGALSDPEEIFLFTDFISSNNVNFIPYLNIIISGSNANTDLTSGNGSLTTSNTSTNVTGSLSSFTEELLPGYGLYSSSNVFIGTVNSVISDTSLTLANNARISVTTNAFRYTIGSYGFPKDPIVGFNGVIADALTANAFTIGTIASLKAINPGTNYNANPFILVRNAFIAGFNRKNIILTLADRTGLFRIGDQLTQTFITPSIEVQYNNLVFGPPPANTGFIVGEGVTQNTGSSNSFATIRSSNTLTSTLVLTDLTGSIIANNSGGLNLVGLRSGTTANIQLSSGASITSLSRGTIIDIPSFDTIEIKRDSFNESFQIGSGVVSSSAGNPLGVATVLSIEQNENSQPMGNNAVISANVTTAVGIASVLEILNSGVGHQPGDVIELVTANNQFAITGRANVFSQGKGDGYWLNNQGKLNSDKYIIDNSYYQNYSYEVRSTLSLNKYSDILKKLAHVAGTKLFGKALINSFTILPLVPVRSEYPDSLLINRTGAILLQRNDNFILSKKRNYSVTSYTGLEVYDRFENRVVTREQGNRITFGEDTQITLRY